MWYYQDTVEDDKIESTQTARLDIDIASDFKTSTESSGYANSKCYPSNGAGYRKRFKGKDFKGL